MNGNDVLVYMENNFENIETDFITEHYDEFKEWGDNLDPDEMDEEMFEKFVKFVGQEKFDRFVEEHMVNTEAAKADALYDAFKEGEL